MALRKWVMPKKKKKEKGKKKRKGEEGKAAKEVAEPGSYEAPNSTDKELALRKEWAYHCHCRDRV